LLSQFLLMEYEREEVAREAGTYFKGGSREK